jgi:hypothetical protein
MPPNGLELSCPAEAGRPSLLYAWPAGDSSIPESAARWVNLSELLGSDESILGDAVPRGKTTIPISRLGVDAQGEGLGSSVHQ